MLRKHLGLGALIIFSLVLVAWATPPQQISSGGSAVTITQGGNQATVSAGGGLKVDVNGTVPVSGPLTDAQLRASAIGVSGPLTDAQLRASAVPISGTVTANSAPLTACGGTNYDSGIVTMPNSTTVLTASTVCLSSITLINLTASQQTCTVTDGQVTPGNLIPPSYDISARGFVRFPLDGARALSGVKWSCTNASAVAGIVRGNQ